MSVQFRCSGSYHCVFHAVTKTTRRKIGALSTKESLSREMKMKSKLARLDLRLDSEIKTLASRASALVGPKTLNEFVVQAIREKASRTIEEAEVVRLNSEAFAAFQAACESPEPANETLTAAMRRSRMRKQERVNNRGSEQPAP